MDGTTTVTYLRTCQLGENPDCARRQQEVLQAILQHLRDLNWLTQLPSLWGIYQNMVQTDLSPTDAASLALFVGRLKAGQLHSLGFDSGLAAASKDDRGQQVVTLGERSKVDAAVDGIFNAGCPGCSTASAGPPQAAAPWNTVLRELARACTWAAGTGLAPGLACQTVP